VSPRVAGSGIIGAWLGESQVRFWSAAPPTKPAKAASPEELAAWHRARTQQSSQRICVEHANAEHKQWRALQRWIGRREQYAETHLAIAGLVSDRAARR
jgi:hypothetical protein